MAIFKNCDLASGFLLAVKTDREIGGRGWEGVHSGTINGAKIMYDLAQISCL